jgi:two-component system, cell cycle sensor histidine kinase and response regulator CckA
VEHRIVRPDGEIRHMAVRGRAARDKDGNIVRAHGANEDITERKRTEQALAAAEEQLRQSQKMEAIGQLAGGIAHDFNNLLTAIIGNSELALGEMPPDDSNRVFVEEIKEVSGRAAALTQQILAFSRRQMLKPEVINLNDVVSNLKPMLERIIRESIATETRLDPALESTKVDPGRMEQVLLNLAVNASDAMPEGGRLVIETANVTLDDAYCAIHTEVAPGDYVMLAVSDTGSGMDEDTCGRIFEPFFTTKVQGQGTGLGLSMVFGIVHQSGGSIAVESAPGKGTTLKVYLPVSRAKESRPSGQMPRRELVNGTETVFVVEDEPPVRQLVVRLLQRAGYATLEAGSGPEAAAILHQGGPLDLLLTDMVLPGGMGGREVAAAVRAARPGVPVVFMSGYTQDSSVFAGTGDECFAFLEKPFAPDVLLKAVRGALDGGGR